MKQQYLPETCYTKLMKHLTVKQAKEFENSKTCYGVNYPIDDNDINVALIQITGRYPEEGRTTNEKCKEIIYVIQGEGEAYIDEHKRTLKKNDVLFIDKNEKYYIQGNMTLFVPCTPAWTEEQHKMIP